MRKIIVALIIVSCLAFSMVSLASVENYPEKPIRIIIPFDPGGGSDILTRAADKYLNLEQPRVMVYLPGAAGLVGAMETLKEKPDGYTILGHNANNIVAQYLSETTDIMLWRELEYICDLVIDHTVIATSPKTGWKSFEDAVEYARENPGQLKWGVEGARGISALTCLMVQDATGLEFRLVPYDGGAESRAALLGGHIDLLSTTVSMVKALEESGDMVPLVMMDDTRSPYYPGIPTLQELGYDAVAFQPRSFYAPPGTPKAIIDKLADAFEEVSKNENFIKEMEELVFVVRFRGPEDAFQVAEDMYNDWETVFKTYFSE